MDSMAGKVHKALPGSRLVPGETFATISERNGLPPLGGDLPACHETTAWGGYVVRRVPIPTNGDVVCDDA